MGSFFPSGSRGDKNKKKMSKSLMSRQDDQSHESFKKHRVSPSVIVSAPESMKCVIDLSSPPPRPTAASTEKCERQPHSRGCRSHSPTGQVRQSNKTPRDDELRRESESQVPLFLLQQPLFMSLWSHDSLYSP